MSKAVERQSQRDRILEAALQHIPFDGWNRRALLAGAADIGIDAATTKRLFPRGGDDLLAHLDVWVDRRLVEAVDQQAIDRLRMRERIARLVRMRLEILSPHREAMRRAIAARLLPTNAMAAGPALWRSIDLIWAIAGDRADDASYYTKRGLLLAVWTSTFFYWLEDQSPGLED
ncbi:MAG: COQ9 family protein, partial [Geminicoccaceae bacterium]